MGTTTPAVNEDVRDGRTGTGPFTYELGTKITVDKTMSLVALRFYKHALETGTHVGRVWISAGTQLASVTYQGETASGWQRQALDSPITLQAGQTYTVSVGLNTRYVATEYGLQTALDNGPLHSVVGANGVYGASAGTFPTASWHNSNYFVDAVVKNPGSANVPQVTARTPVSGATQVDTATKVTATFSTALSPASVNASTFTLKTAAGTAVPATVAYDGPTRTATLTPSSALAGGTAYTATLTTGIRADDETPMAARRELGLLDHHGHGPDRHRRLAGRRRDPGRGRHDGPGDVLGLGRPGDGDRRRRSRSAVPRAPSRPPWPTTTPRARRR